MTNSDGKNDRQSWRRWDGKWVWPGKKINRGETPKKILSRFWYLLIPFIGLMCSQESYVRPHLVHFEDVTNRERKLFLDNRDALKLNQGNLETEITNVQFEMDTTVIPQAAFYEMILDSLVTIRRTFDESLPVTEALIDSLRGVNQNLVAESQYNAGVWARRKVTRDSLRQQVLIFADSLVALADTIDAKEHLVYRVLHPGEFRKETSLFPGEADYPDRDKLPKR
ncbi:MAG: hypothetical protein KJ970_19040 [Candidatus Eisenbacteria bacterium]|uniref:Uncharacterized protein n=1 Tax=Eiseniibacteriota bacterium TaxID=2212470 RepID=A0A948RZW0_UNCEI|nr:hypothetical protein [Candidatus Eisenbacteria bacterium]MBU1947254.1 hypothetical protein [Candidatus Eisenbacteria bacterium]MBU2693016.1 hypothetical protein [Candidatus Eisenbacteria bacterium]